MSSGPFPVILSPMRPGLSAVLVLLLAVAGLEARQPWYGELWDQAVPFHEFLESVKARQDEWKPRFANAAIDAAVLTELRAVPGRRRLLVVATDRCSDSAWAVPYVAKLAAAVPEKLELRVIGTRGGRPIQGAHLTPDGRLATPTVAVLDDSNRFIGAWVERPAELQKWYIANKPKVSSGELDAHVSRWYDEDAGRSTIREVMTILGRDAAEGK